MEGKVKEKTAFDSGTTCQKHPAQNKRGRVRKYVFLVRADNRFISIERAHIKCIRKIYILIEKWAKSNEQFT